MSTPRIELNRTRWDEIKGRVETKIALVYHEYSAIAGVDDQRYAISGPLLRRLKAAAVLTHRIGETLDFAKTVAHRASYFKHRADKGTEREYCYFLGVLGQLLRGFRNTMDDAQSLELAIDPEWNRLRSSLPLPDVETLSFDLCQPMDWKVINGQPNDGLEAAIKVAGEIADILESHFMLIEGAKHLDVP
jgi:hypothetical protein